MLQSLIDIDRSWLLAINGAHIGWADSFFWYVSQSTTWLPLYVILIICLVVRFRGQRVTLSVGKYFSRSEQSLSIALPAIVIILLGFVVAVGGADLICAKLIKPLVARPRPTHDAELSSFIHIVNGYRGGAYGFCSNHAANTMACATLFAGIMTYNRPAYSHAYITLPMMVWVVLNCYSRMYLGVHFPLDILAGLVVGVVMALVVWLPLRGCLFPPAACVRLADEE